jgi:predicted HicB family RNase H-like nuclease
MTIKEQCVYVCGPYKGYRGRAEYDDDAKIFHGDVIGTRDVITFQGATLDELRGAFTASVDDYLAFCHETGSSAEKPFSGQFVARMSPELHRRVSMMAQASGKSLNQFLCDCLEAMTSSCAPTISQAQAVKPRQAKPAPNKPKRRELPASSNKTRKKRERKYA